MVVVAAPGQPGAAGQQASAMRQTEGVDMDQ